MHPTAPMLVPSVRSDRTLGMQGNANAQDSNANARRASVGGGPLGLGVAPGGPSIGDHAVGTMNAGMPLHHASDSPLLSLIMSRRRSLGSLSSSAPLSPSFCSLSPQTNVSFVPLSLSAMGQANSGGGGGSGGNNPESYASNTGDLDATAGPASGSGAPSPSSTFSRGLNMAPLFTGVSGITPTFSPRMSTMAAGAASGSPIQVFRAPWSASASSRAVPTSSSSSSSSSSTSILSDPQSSASSSAFGLPSSQHQQQPASQPQVKKPPTVSPMLVSLCENEWDFS